MSELLCRDCLEQGHSVKATHRLPGKTPVCDQHMSNRLGKKYLATSNAQVIEAQEENKMPKGTRLDETKIASIKREAAAGASFQELSHKYGVSWATVQYHAGKNGKKLAGGGEGCASREWTREAKARTAERSFPSGTLGLWSGRDLACAAA